jgi:hypothetical protein
MRQILPKSPKNLNPYARELLGALAGHPESAEIVLGGGVALSHYLEYRGTVDLDAWWRQEVRPETRELTQRLMEELAAKHGLQFRLRAWGEKNTERDPQDGCRKVLFHVERLELQRPLEKIQSPEERDMTLDHSVYPDVEDPCENMV